MAARAETYPPLESVNKPNLTTREAAHYLDRAPQTLRIWKCNGTGLVRPLNILGRLAWPTAEVKRVVLGVK